MRILCFSVTPSPYQRNFFEALATQDGVNITVAYFEQVPDDSPWQFAELESWEEVLPGMVFGKGRVRCHWNLLLHEFSNYDVIIVNGPLTGVTTQRLFRLLTLKNAPPWVFWGEQLLPRTGLRGFIQKMLAASLGKATTLVAIGEAARQDYQQRFPQLRVCNIPYACRLTEFEQAGSARKASSVCRFLFAGQMIKRKGVDILLGAFEMVLQSGRDVELQLVGREGDLMTWMEALSPTTREKIVYYGFKQPADLPVVFGRADVFILPSRHDGWGVVVNQALGAKMPVITTTAAGAGRDLVEDGVNGLHVLAGEKEPLFRAMCELVDNPERRCKMAEEAYYSSLKVRPEAAAERWMAVLKDVSGG